MKTIGVAMSQTTNSAFHDSDDDEILSQQKAGQSTRDEGLAENTMESTLISKSASASENQFIRMGTSNYTL